MADADTALLEGATGTELGTTADTPESAQVETPANADLGATTETEVTPDPLADFDDDSLTNSQRVKALLDAQIEKTAKDVEARVRESERQKSEAALKSREREFNAQQRARQIQEAEAAERGGVYQGLVSLVDSIVDHEADPEAKNRFGQKLPQLQGIANQIAQAAAVRQDTLSVALVNQHLQANFPEYRIEPNTVAEFNDALNRGDFAKRQEITYQLVADAAVKAKESSLRETIVKEIKAQTEKDAKLAQERANSTTAKGQGGPTNVAGSSTGTTNSQKYLSMTAAQIADLSDAELERAVAAGIGSLGR